MTNIYWLHHEETTTAEEISALQAQDLQSTCNQLATDCISRQAAIDALNGLQVKKHMPKETQVTLESAKAIMRLLPSAQPEPHYDEWCDDCKEYDKERHCCPRWNKVIRDTLKDAQPEQRWIPVDLRNNSPEENKVVLLGVRFRDDFKYFVTSRQDYNYWTGLGREIKGELRWQELPEPYREEGEK